MVVPHIRIDNVELDVPQGLTILAAARLAGVEIPHLCWMEGVEAQTSCLVCVVRVNGAKRMVPACATRVAEGMVIENQSDDVKLARRTALELLLAEHTGECFAPCAMVCPAKLDIPRMMRQVRQGDVSGAAAGVRDTLVLPAVLGYVCPGLCEKGCRRGSADEAVSICAMHRYVAETEMAGGQVWRREKRPATGKRVAIVGSGPVGLAAAWELLKAGHACVVFDAHEEAGGTLRYGIEPAKLPREVLDAEIAIIVRLGAELRLGKEMAPQELAEGFDAVLWTSPPPGGVTAGAKGWFVSASAGTPRQHAVQAIADGKDLAEMAGSYLLARTSKGRKPRFAVRLGQLSEQDRKQFMANASPAARAQSGGATLKPEEADAEARRCMLCGCGSIDVCALRRYSQEYGADANHYRGDRRALRRVTTHPDIEFEEGKCISCGLCVAITRQEAEPLGLSFVGRGFDVRVAVPFEKTMESALTRAGERVVKACPTGALHRK